MLKILKPDFTFENETGLLVQLAHEGYSQINVLKSKKGSLRGGHYHKISREAFYVLEGNFELVLTRDDEKQTYNFKAGDMFMIEPYAKHTFNFLEDTIMVSLYDICVERENGEKDIYK